MWDTLLPEDALHMWLKTLPVVSSGNRHHAPCDISCDISELLRKLLGPFTNYFKVYTNDLYFTKLPKTAKYTYCGIPPCKPRPGPGRGLQVVHTVVDGVYRRRNSKVYVLWHPAL